MKDPFVNPFKVSNIFDYKDNFVLYENIKSTLLYDDLSDKEPIISIVIPCYNDKYLKYALESAYNQKDAPDYEIVIVDNKVEADRTDLLDYIIKQNKHMTRFYKNEENLGMAGNWNRCALLAKSDYIVYLHSDDMLTEDCLHTLWAVHQRIDDPYASILGRHNNIDAQSKLTNVYNYKSRILKLFYRKKYFKYSKFDMFFMPYDNGCGELINKKMLIKIGGWSQDTYPATDFTMFANYHKQCSVYRVNHAIKNSRIANNDSFQFANIYPACNYFIRKNLIEHCLGNFSILHYLNCRFSEQESCPEFNVVSKEPPTFTIQFIKKCMMMLSNFINQYSLKPVML